MTEQEKNEKEALEARIASLQREVVLLKGEVERLNGVFNTIQPVIDNMSHLAESYLSNVANFKKDWSTTLRLIDQLKRSN